MTLVESRPKRVTLLCALYMAQGVPWGFMTVALISYLAVLLPLVRVEAVDRKKDLELQANA